MNKNYLEIDLSGSDKDNYGEDKIEIQLKSGSTVQFSFSRFFFRSKYIFDKYSEIMKSIEREIVEIENKYSIKEEIIKEFIEIIQEDKVIIPIEHYKDIYTLSEHFHIPKLTALLDDMMENLIDTNLNFCIQILIDETETEKEDTEIVRKIENFLKARLNECLKNDKFKEVPIPSICRIIELAISTDREVVDVDDLLDFIVESATTRFVLFKFVELHRLSKYKLKEFIQFIDEQEENAQQMYLEYIPLNFVFLKQIMQENDELSNKLNESKEGFNRRKVKFNHSKSDPKQCANAVIVCGYDRFNQLGEKPNKSTYIHPSMKSSIDPSSLLSFSVYSYHSVQVTKSGKLLGIGDNRNGRISDSLSKTIITEFTEFSIKDRNGHQLDPISAVCGFYGTLYMFSSGSRRQLVLCDCEINGGHPVFLDIGNEYPVSLFGGECHSAAISRKGEVIFINRNAVKKSPESKIKTVCLPDGEKAVSVACCYDSVVALSSNGRVFLSAVESGSSVLNFSTVSELSDQEIVWVSGTSHHFLAVSSEGRVFGRGSNEFGQLGLGQKTSEVASFTEISSLKSDKFRAAYAGFYHSLFETFDGKVFACGYNGFSRLFLSNDTDKNVYSPEETTITESATFCIAGAALSAVFIGGDPPPNTPNNLIEN